MLRPRIVSRLKRTVEQPRTALSSDELYRWYSNARSLTLLEKKQTTTQ
jgi:hypothetical protein